MTARTPRSASDREPSERRHPEVPLSRDRIVSEALALVDREGLAALSMRRLAAVLGVDPMAIYYYLPNKAALQDAIVEAVNVEIEGPSDFPLLPLYDVVTTAAQLFRAALLRHPRAVPLLVTRPLATPVGMEPADVMLGALVRGGMTPAEGIAAIDVFSTFVTASVLRQVQMPAGPEGDPHSQMRKIKDVLDPTDFPNLAQAMAEGGLMDFDAEFEFGIRALARGFAEVVAARAAR